jgi:hypothetical protein
MVSEPELYVYRLNNCMRPLECVSCGTSARVRKLLFQIDARERCERKHFGATHLRAARRLAGRGIAALLGVALLFGVCAVASIARTSQLADPPTCEEVDTRFPKCLCPRLFKLCLEKRTPSPYLTLKADELTKARAGVQQGNTSRGALTRGRCKGERRVALRLAACCVLTPVQMTGV